MGDTTGRSGDWVVSSQGLTAAGVGSTIQGWGGNVALASGVAGSVLLVALPTAAAATGQPTIGYVEIGAVHGKVTFATNVAATTFTFAVAIYIAELNSSATAWSVRDPNMAADANRDDYLFLDTQIAELSTPATATSPEKVEFRLGLSQPVRIGGGQGLCLTASNAANTGSCQITAYFNARALVRRAM